MGNRRWSAKKETANNPLLGWLGRFCLWYWDHFDRCRTTKALAYLRSRFKWDWCSVVLTLDDDRKHAHNEKYAHHGDEANGRKRMSSTCRTDKTQDKEQIRQERQDRVPPLRRDNFRQTETWQTGRERSTSRNPGRDDPSPRKPRTPPHPTTRSPTPNRRVNPQPWREDRRKHSKTPQGRRTMPNRPGTAPGRILDKYRKTDTSRSTSSTRTSRTVATSDRRTLAEFRHMAKLSSTAPILRSELWYQTFWSGLFSTTLLSAKSSHQHSWICTGIHCPVRAMDYRNNDGTWLDLVPQTPDQSIFSTSRQHNAVRTNSICTAIPSEWD